MKRRRRKKNLQAHNIDTAAPKAGSLQDVADKPPRLGHFRLKRPILVGAGVVFTAALVAWATGGLDVFRARSDVDTLSAGQTGPGLSSDEKKLGEPEEKSKTGAASSGSFLDSFNNKDAKGPDLDKGAAAANDALEAKLKRLLDNQERRSQITKMATRSAALTRADIPKLLKEQKALTEQFNKLAADLETELRAARASRSKDPVPEWLTGELHKLVGGDPDQVLTHLQKAADAGLDRARLFASLAWVQVDNNHLELAARLATKALDRDTRGRYAWNAYARAAFCVQKFAEVMDRVDEAFPSEAPEWAAEIRREASRLQRKWEDEQKIRAAEKKANDLPRVRLLIKHRRFVRGPDGTQTKIETTGGGEVVLELFENEAPNTVANFLTLVASGFYDGTRFHLSIPALFVAGGDPNSKNEETDNDSRGTPGYIVPDEFAAPRARSHFRGYLTMFNLDKPETAGCQFLITLSPQIYRDGHFTVFGRVIKGQNVVDKITMGRTSKNFGEFGRVVPGDLLEKAEVIRKRPHVYKVIKLSGGSSPP